MTTLSRYFWPLTSLFRSRPENPNNTDHRSVLEEPMNNRSVEPNNFFFVFNFSQRALEGKSFITSPPEMTQHGRQWSMLGCWLLPVFQSAGGGPQGTQSKAPQCVLCPYSVAPALLKSGSSVQKIPRWIPRSRQGSGWSSTARGREQVPQPEQSL